MTWLRSGPSAPQETLDNFAPSADHKRERRPRTPHTMAQWATCADNQARAFTLLYRAEHTPERASLVAMNESNHHEWPREAVVDLWEEFNWRWWEELKQNYRSFLRATGSEAFTRSDLQLFALARRRSGADARQALPLGEAHPRGPPHPAGPRSHPGEAARALRLAPTDAEGRIFC